MTASEMQARMLKRIDDDPGTPATVTPAEAMAALNEAQELAAWLSLCLEQTSPWTLPASTFLSLRASFPDFQVPLRVEIAGVHLEPATFADLDALNDQWQATAGTPVNYFTLGFNFAGVTPQPVVDTVAQLTYARAPLQMVGDDFPEIPEEYHQNLVDYGAYRVRLKEGAQGLARGAKYLNRFLDAMAELSDVVRTRSRAAQYDVEPFEIKLFDRSRLIQQIAAKGRRPLVNK